MVPGSTLMYGSSLTIETLIFRDSRIAARDAAAIPLPREETTPPVTNTYLVMERPQCWKFLFYSMGAIFRIVRRERVNSPRRTRRTRRQIEGKRMIVIRGCVCRSRGPRKNAFLRLSFRPSRPSWWIPRFWLSPPRASCGVGVALRLDPRLRGDDDLHESLRQALPL